jgi:hypothetical protein
MECREHAHSWTTRTSDLIHPCQLSAANSLEYLVEQQRHARNLAARSTEWMSWNHRETIERVRV